MGDDQRIDDFIFCCEGCRNYLSIKKQDAFKVMPCPLCGTLNDLQPEIEDNLRGVLKITSSVVDMKRKDVESGLISLSSLPDPVQDSLIWLQNNGWKINFHISASDGEENTNAGVDPTDS